MTEQRIVRKSRVVQEDMEFGEGTVTQTRNSLSYVVNQFRHVQPVNSEAELLALDPDKFKKAIYFDGAGKSVLCYYDGTQWVAGSNSGPWLDSLYYKATTTAWSSGTLFTALADNITNPVSNTADWEGDRDTNIANLDTAIPLTSAALIHKPSYVVSIATATLQTGTFAFSPRYDGAWLATARALSAPSVTTLTNSTWSVSGLGDSVVYTFSLSSAGVLSVSASPAVSGVTTFKVFV